MKLPAFITFKNLYLIGLAGIALGLAFSKVFVSVGLFFVSGTWLISGNYIGKIKRYLSNPLAWIWGILFLVHVLWMFNTENWEYGLKDLRIKVPLFILPFIIAGMPPINRKEWKIIIYLFLAVLFLTGFAVEYLWMGWGKTIISDPRYLSPRVSHIRLAIMLSIGIITCLYLVNQKENSPTEKKILLLVVLQFLITLILLKSFTGFVLSAVGLLLMLFSNLKPIIKFSALGIIVVSGIYVSLKFKSIISDFNYAQVKANTPLLDKTPGGKPYLHSANEIDMENGELVYINYQPDEMKNAWNLRSDLPYDSTDLKGHRISNTLPRYLTSLHYPRNSEGVNLLTPADILNIKKGCTNIKYLRPLSLDTKLYEIAQDIATFKNNADPNNKSISMRLEFLTTGCKIFTNYFWQGTGTGDVQDAFNWQYSYDNNQLIPENRLRAHNQFLSFAISFGIIGGLFCLFLLSYSLIKVNDPLFRTVYFILLLSFLNEDTLETQAGLSIFIFLTMLYWQYAISSKQNTIKEEHSLNSTTH